MSWAVALRLGRISNLPTVWTNVLAGVALAGGPLWEERVLFLMVAMSLFYCAGMYLNDAFDREIDAFERPERPIPSGAVSARAVFVAGFGMMLAGLVLLTWIGHTTGEGANWRALAAGLALCTCIVIYDYHHKTNPLSPFVMGLCRMLVYVTSGYAMAAEPSPILLYAGLILLSWLIGLTYVAKQENLGRVENLWPVLFLAAPIVYGLTIALDRGIVAPLWVTLVALTLYALYILVRRQPGDVPRAVVSLIAGISLVDGLFIANVGEDAVALFAFVAFALTLALQRVVPGT